jgi:hypothetical protein
MWHAASTMTLYVLALYAHSYLRWVVLALTVAVTLRSALGLLRGAAWSSAHARVQQAMLHAADLQLLIGVTLYLWLSPFTRGFFHAPRAGFADSTLRFFGVEHVFGMACAITLMHLGQERAQRAPDARGKHRRTCWLTGAALLLMAASVPWPFMPYPRPLLRPL